MLGTAHWLSSARGRFRKCFARAPPAGHRARGRRGSSGASTGARRIAFKGAPANLVTEMDARAEGLPRQAPRALPDAAILSEEMGAAGRLRRWIVDPLDGTTNYAHGIPIFGVSIALETAAGETGVIYDPNRRTYVAERPRRW